MHNCERKQGKVWEVTLNRENEAFCMSCGRKIQDEDIAEEVLKIIKQKREKNQKWKKK